jgi:hypothetical protein
MAGGASSLTIGLRVRDGGQPASPWAEGCMIIDTRGRTQPSIPSGRVSRLRVRGTTSRNLGRASSLSETKSSLRSTRLATRPARQATRCRGTCAGNLGPVFRERPRLGRVDPFCGGSSARDDWGHHAYLLATHPHRAVGAEGTRTPDPLVAKRRSETSLLSSGFLCTVGPLVRPRP